MFKPIEVTPLPGYRLHIRYSDGVEGDIDLAHLVGHGVFALWMDPKRFEQVSLGESGEIRWNDDVDVCSDALYLEITGKLPEDLFPNLKATVNA
jgi:hypothetical protein